MILRFGPVWQTFGRKSQLVQHSEQVHPGHAGQVYLVEDVDSAQVPVAPSPYTTSSSIVMCSKTLFEKLKICI
jgi:hypothetical protein